MPGTLIERARHAGHVIEVRTTKSVGLMMRIVSSSRATCSCGWTPRILNLSKGDATKMANDHARAVLDADAG